MAVLLTTLWRRLAMDAEGTRRALGGPALVWEAPPRSTSDSDHWQLTATGDGKAPNRPGPGEALVYVVEKRPAGLRNPFPMGVTVGRVEANDVVVDHLSVSRFHAYFQLDARTQVWTLTDAESRNGTWINGMKLKARQRVELLEGAELRFGDASLKYFTPDGLVRFIERYGEPPVKG